MCGLTGFLAFKNFGPECENYLSGMADAIRHRGPDDHGIWVDADAGIGLAHRRLSILDLSPQGHQPMVSARGRYVIVFNGEVYNFKALRRELDSLGENGVRLNLAGNFEDEKIKEKCFRHRNWKYVDYFGYIDKVEVKGLLKKSKIGLVTLHPLKRHLYGLPVKMFEYMAMGLPIIASEIGQIKDLLKNEAGILVKPGNVLELAQKIEYLAANPEYGKLLGAKARKKILSAYTWDHNIDRFINFIFRFHSSSY